MAEKFTEVFGPGLDHLLWNVRGHVTAEEAIEDLRRYMRHQLEEAQCILAADPATWTIRHKIGMHRSRNEVTIQDGKRAPDAAAQPRTETGGSQR